MFIFYIILILLSLVGIRYKKDVFYSDYIDRAQCNSIKGFFIIVVFLRHITSFLYKNGYEPKGILDYSYSIVDNLIGQLLVVMFLFYSGYGVMESVKAKGAKYVNSYPKKRILTTLLNFDVAVCAFIVSDILLSIPVTISQVGASLIGWQTVGNSNWYIFVILCCYVATYISYLISKFWEGQFLNILLLITIVLMVTLTILKEAHWYNTMLCFPAGMFYSKYKTNLEETFQKHYITVVALLIMLFLGSFIYNYLLYPQLWGFTYNFESTIFALIVVTITMKVKIGNGVLIWLGLNLFPIYIYQRLPMIAIRQIVGSEFICQHAYTYVIICLIVTLIITYLYKYWRISF